MQIAAGRLFGFFGDPVGHSLSPHLQNEAFRLLGINGVYLSFAIKPEELGTAVAAVRCLKMGGVNAPSPTRKGSGLIWTGWRMMPS